MNRIVLFFTVLLTTLLFACSSDSEPEPDNIPSPTPNPPQEEESSCEGSVNFILDEVGGDFILFSLSTNGNYTAFDLQYGPVGFSLGQGTSIRVNATSGEVDNLEINTEYDIYVRGVCSNANGDWLDPTSFATLCDSGSFTGTVRLNTQADVETFGRQCYTSVTGDLIINGASGVDPVTDLSQLTSLTSIDGSLEITENQSLMQLDGLENLTRVNHLRLYLNWNLISIEALSGLIEISSVTDPNSPTEVAGIDIESCRSLKSLEGLQNITKVGRLDLRQNFELENLNGLRGLTSVTERILLFQNLAITSMAGLDQLESVESDFLVQSNSDLVTLNGLESLVYVGGELQIFSNQSLTSLAAISNVQSADNLTIRSNQNLTNFTGININQIQTRIWLESNANTDFTGISGTATTALILIRSNFQLTSLNGFQGITSFGEIELTNNNSLNTLNGLEDLRNTDSRILISQNSSLSDFCALNGLIQEGTLNGSWEVSLNAVNPTLTDMQNGNCN